MDNLLDTLYAYLDEAYCSNISQSLSSIISHCKRDSKRLFLSPLTYKRYAEKEKTLELLLALGITCSTENVTYDVVNNAIHEAYKMTSSEFYSKFKKFDFDNLNNAFTSDMHLLVEEILDRVTQYNILTYYQENFVPKIISMIVNGNLLSNQRFIGSTYNWYINKHSSFLKRIDEVSYFTIKEMLRQISELDITCHEILYTRIIILDTETTDLRPKNYPIQISMMECDLSLQPVKLETFHIEQDYIAPSATKKSHGLTVETLLSQPDLLTRNEAVERVKNWLRGNKIIIGHNVSFDEDAVKLLYKQTEEEPPEINTLCTYNSKQRLELKYGTPANFKNETLANYYKDPTTVSSLYQKFQIPTQLQVHDSTHDIFLTYVILAHNLQLIRPS